MHVYNKSPPDTYDATYAGEKQRIDGDHVCWTLVPTHWWGREQIPKDIRLLGVPSKLVGSG